ncbi:hypothetical protein BDV96DRAFT_657006 [Lophiotrema nucula]|uniref:Uncharacterized protein n=1 Tax=Lophiotrema nucula TaxID=690887 RepID=A0A6A5ZF47_9PLEO|nr:hypothetical protein BDV96DRAFT_657006 [Lophiotrema nucula]
MTSSWEVEPKAEGTTRDASYLRHASFNLQAHRKGPAAGNSAQKHAQTRRENVSPAGEDYSHLQRSACRRPAFSAEVNVWSWTQGAARRHIHPAAASKANPSGPWIRRSKSRPAPTSAPSSHATFPYVLQLHLSSLPLRKTTLKKPRSPPPSSAGATADLLARPRVILPRAHQP